MKLNCAVFFNKIVSYEWIYFTINANHNHNPNLVLSFDNLDFSIRIYEDKRSKIK